MSEAETLGGVTAAQWTPARGGGIKQGRGPPNAPNEHLFTRFTADVTETTLNQSAEEDFI